MTVLARRPNDTNAIALVEQARKALAKANTVREVRHIREWIAHVSDRAARIKRLAETQELRGNAHAAWLDAQEVRIHAWRREGDLLKQLLNAGQRRPRGVRYQMLQAVASETLEQLGYKNTVDPTRAHQIAAIPERMVAQYFQQQRQRDLPATVSGLIQFAADALKRSQTTTPTFAPGEFRTLVIDPPWPMTKIGRAKFPKQGIKLDYPIQTVEEIDAIVKRQLESAHENTHLYLWVTHRFLPDGLRLLEGWGFTYHCLLTWVKPSGFTPFSFMFNTEHVVFGYRGALDLLQKGLKVGFSAPVGEHSEKPDAFYELVMHASPAPRLELFARKPRPGWEVWGDEISDRSVSVHTTT